ncbi:MAG: hypothetical protein Q9174_007284, partial [Haloplaca sp. 1 TL-2023]
MMYSDGKGRSFAALASHIYFIWNKNDAYSLAKDFQKVTLDKSGLRMVDVDRLFVQVGTWRAIFEMHATELKTAIEDSQKNINRGFVPVVSATLAGTYYGCNSQR